MTLPASPAIQLSADNVTWGAPGAPLRVAAGAPFYARLNSTSHVDSTTWSILSTDDVGSAPALTPSGIVDSHVTGTAGAAGTAFLLRSKINAGVDSTTNNDNPLTTTATVAVRVPAANGRCVMCFDEHAEEGSQWWLPLVNAAIRGANDATMTTTRTPTAAKALTANNTSAEVSIFQVTGQVVVKKLWGIVTTAIGSNHTGEKFYIDDGALQSDITISAGVPALSSFPVGSILLSAAEGSPVIPVSSATSAINSNTGGPVFQEYLIGKKATAATAIKYHYATTNTPGTGAITFYCEWEPVSADGAVAAL